MKKTIRVWITILTAVALAAAVGLCMWFQGLFLPRFITWQQKTLEIDSVTNIQLKHKKLTVNCDGEVIWESPEGVKVSDFLWCDIDHDEEMELLLLCWRRGRYGKARPYWEKGKSEEISWSQHIYIYDYKKCDNNNGKYTEILPIWMASDIGMDVKNWSFDPETRLEITENNGRITHWDWISWGLSLID